jgi:hypothetical protein
MDKPHVYRAGPKGDGFDSAQDIDPLEIRRNIEPWLSAVFQSDHLSLLVGNGLSTAISHAVGSDAASMDLPEFGCELNDKINRYAKKSARAIGRGTPNVEDKIRAASQLITGLKILQDDRHKDVRKSLNKTLREFVESILKSEEDISYAIEIESDEGLFAKGLLISFLLSFASRSISRERLHIFTTNYDRLIEYGCDLVGLHVLDRFVGGLAPVFRSSRVEIDLHYNPPGIRGEPRYLEGVVKLTKLHGSIDWRFKAGKVQRYAIPFGSDLDHPDIPKRPFQQVMIYPNPAKDVETLEYPYAELFRDFASSLCRHNSALITYGYGFGDDHINRVILDMLSIPSTHLVIISFDDNSDRIQNFCAQASHEPQISLLIGDHFGELSNLTQHYLPKSAIDKISSRWADLLKRRAVPTDTEDE